MPESDVALYVPECMRARGYDFQAWNKPQLGDKECNQVTHIRNWPPMEVCYQKPDFDMWSRERERGRKQTAD